MTTTDNEAPSTSDGATDDSRRIGGQPIDGNGVYPFAGLTRYDDDVDASVLPSGVEEDTSSMRFWTEDKIAAAAGESVQWGDDIDASVLPERGLHTMIPNLPRANRAQAAWIHPRTGKVMRTEKHSAVIDPERAESAVGGYQNYPEAISDVTGRDEDAVREDLEELSIAEYKEDYLSPEQQEAVETAGIGDDALFQIAGDNFTIINPQQPLEELCAVLRERELADKCFGEVTIDRDGGRASLDVYFDGEHVESPVFADNRKPVVVGLQVQWSFFDDWAFRVCGQALDWKCTNHIHRMTDREIVKYAGDVEARTDWRELFRGVLDRLDEKRDQLSRIIEAASGETLDFSQLPADFGSQFEDEPAPPWTALYSHLGLPLYLSRHAGKRLRSQADDAYEPDWWEIHSAATWAVSHHDRGDRSSGGSFEQHARIANDMLMNPAEMVDRVVGNYEDARRDDEQTTLAEEGGGSAEIRTAFEDTKEKKERFEQWENDLRDMNIEV